MIRTMKTKIEFYDCQKRRDRLSLSWSLRTKYRATCPIFLRCPVTYIIKHFLCGYWDLDIWYYKITQLTLSNCRMWAARESLAFGRCGIQQLRLSKATASIANWSWYEMPRITYQKHPCSLWEVRTRQWGTLSDFPIVRSGLHGRGRISSQVVVSGVSREAASRTKRDHCESHSHLAVWFTGSWRHPLSHVLELAFDCSLHELWTYWWIQGPEM